MYNSPAKLTRYVSSETAVLRVLQIMAETAMVCALSWRTLTKTEYYE